MDGLIVIDKPAGITSHDVVARVRRILKTKRVGHTGTLDPFATGVMVILVGQATRLAQFLDKDEKEYEAVVRFGFETDTGDGTGVRTLECGMRSEELSELLGKVDWDDVLGKFRGEIDQVPPMYSAKKVEGKKLYELARSGQTIERTPQRVNVFQLEVLHEGTLRTPHSALRIRIVCSAGTYIRTLAEDIGRSVGVGAHLEELRRTRAGRFAISRAVTLEELEGFDAPASALVPMHEAVEHLPEITLNSDRAAKTKNGLSSRVVDALFADGETVRMAGPDGELLAIGEYSEEEKSVQPKVVLG